jgi:hypothetical protein
MGTRGEGGGGDMKVMKEHKKGSLGRPFINALKTASTNSMPESLSCVLDVKCVRVFSFFGFII